MLRTNIHTDLERHVAKTLLYFDIFNYPLKSSEVFRFLGVNSVSQNDVENALNELTDQKIVFRFGELYCMQNNTDLVKRRERGNKSALEYHDLALKQAKLIARFPFVRAVMASGSLSKDYMDETCDLDFFVVTTAGRLWISRTLLVLYKRLFLGNSHKFFCVNYFIDEAHLEIEEKNLFTATELATVLPLWGREIYERMMVINHVWLKGYFPNFKARDVNHMASFIPGTFKQRCERMLDMVFPDIIDDWCMKATLRRWKKLYRDTYTEKDFIIAFKTKKHASKNHPRNFQKNVMAVYQQKVASFAKKFYSAAKP